MATVLRIASDIGLKAKVDKLTWEGLLAQEGVFPLIAKMKDGNAVIVMAAQAKDSGQVAIPQLPERCAPSQRMSCRYNVKESQFKPSASNTRSENATIELLHSAIMPSALSRSAPA